MRFPGLHDERLRCERDVFERAVVIAAGLLVVIVFHSRAGIGACSGG